MLLVAVRDRKDDPRLPFSTWQVLVGAVSVGVTVGVTIVVGLWGLSTFVLGTVKDDIAAIRSDVDSLEQKSDTTLADVNAKDSEVRDQIANLVPTLTVVVTRLEGVTVNLKGLSTDVASIRNDLNTLQVAFAEANARQVSFETWNVGRNAVGENLPPEWKAGDSAIRKDILGSPSPLKSWADKVLPK